MGYSRPAWAYQRRRSFPYFPDVSRPDFADSLWVHKFTEDISLGILPYDSSKYTFTLVPKTDDEKLVGEVFATREDDPRWFSERIGRFIVEAAHYLANEGELWYEIVRPPPDAPPGDPPFALMILPPGRLTRLPGLLVQHVPAPARARLGKRFTTIPLRQLWQFTLPRVLGTPRQHRSLLRFLGRQQFPPLFSAEAMAPGIDARGYDFAHHRRQYDAALAFATRRWGWIGMWADSVSEHSLVIRALRLKRAQVLMRDQIINTMNALLNREQIAGAIVIEGVLTLPELNVVISDIENGGMIYTEALALLKR